MPNNSDTVPRLAWAITGSGHYLRECLELIGKTKNVDLFLSKAGAEVLQVYGYDLAHLRKEVRIFRDNAASAPPVGLFYENHYHTLVVAPATSNTVAKCVLGISDTLVTNIYAQAGKCRIPSLVFACDTQPIMRTEAPGKEVPVYPRPIDLEHTKRLSSHSGTQVITTLHDLESALAERLQCLNICCS